ncbi:MAG TPA: hypothetical protein VKI41_07055, partial [Vicinamibacteria bacterium]|nr:hypothetical protein [Vicinamibacteria bacterium]
AGLAASRLGGLEALVLWDPVISGAAYLRALRAAHAGWAIEHAQGASSLAEALGFPLPVALAADLAGLEFDRLSPAPARRVLVVSSDVGEGAPLLWPVGQGEAVERRQFPPAPVWLHAEGMDRALVPGELLTAITTWLEGVCA